MTENDENWPAQDDAAIGGGRVSRDENDISEGDQFGSHIEKQTPEQQNGQEVLVPAAQSSTSRFRFVGDTKAPQQLSQLEQLTKRRNREHRSRIASVEERISSCLSSLIRETIQREAGESMLRETSVVRPRETMIEQFVDQALEQGMVQPLNERLSELERQVSLLTQQMINVEAVDVIEWKNEHLIPLQSAIEQLESSIKVEEQKTAKREEALRHRLDTTLASNTSVLYADSNACVAAMLQILEEKTNQVDQQTTEEERIEKLLKEARIVKAALDQERIDRQKRDEEVLEVILATQNKLEKFVLESVSQYEEGPSML